MRYRPLGKTGITVSEIGFGAWGIGGWKPGQLSYGLTDDAVSLAALDRAIELGITFFDTSSLYGMGHSETLIGKALANRRDKVVIATKAGHVDHHNTDYSPDALWRSLEASLVRLQTDYVDVLQLHGPEIEVLRDDPAIIRCLEQMQDQGMIRTYGLSANSPALAHAAVREFGFPVIQANFNMLDIRAIECGLFGIAQEQGVGLIARTPLNFGFLAGNILPDAIFSEQDHRSRFNGEQVQRWASLARIMLDIAKANTVESSVQTALRFCLSPPEVSVVIPGIMTPEEAETNAAAADQGPLLPEVYEKIISMNKNEKAIVR
tara:strand:+ start:43977 stop:44936 length:960 start_codon:yes stop_codon:yes gene_type:complete